MMLPEALLETSRLSLPEAASMFAASGVPVFPCTGEGKRPLTASGFHDASSDSQVVEDWWSRWPLANIGVPTGAVSGIEVVDVDVTADASGFAAFTAAQEAGLTDGGFARVRTPSGGMHVYFPSAPDFPQRCWQSASAHIDFRGDGGYVVVPPSCLSHGGHRTAYRLAALNAAEPHPVDATALRSFIDPASTRPQAPSMDSTATREPSAEIDVQRLAAWVARLHEGERNHGLFWASCRLVEAGFARDTIEQSLGPAAASAGLAADEITVTVHSAERHVTRVATMQPAPHDSVVVSPRVGDVPCR